MNDQNNSSNPGHGQTKLKVRYIEQEEALAFFRFDQTPLSEVIEDLPDGYYEVNLRGDLIAFNRALCRIHGYWPETMVNMNYTDFSPPELHDEIFRTYAEVYNTGRPLQILDYQVTRPDGSVAVIHTSVHLARDKEGKPTGFRGISRDVTEQRRVEAYEQARTRVLESIARNAPIEETLKDILNALRQQMPDCAGMILRAGDDATLECVAGIDVGEKFATGAGKDKIGPEGGACCRAAFTREPVIIGNLEKDSRCREHVDESPASDIRAVWAFPILRGEKSVLGVLVLYPATARKPLEREKQWLHSATATAEIALSHHRMTSELDYLSRHDTLTGILNRRSFMSEAQRLLALAGRKQWSSAMLFLDLDRFKKVNDTWGHQIGDLLLTDTTKRLNACLRQSDCLARLGGDEFAVLLPEAGTQEARIVANRILRVMTEPFYLSGVRASVGISIGIAVCPPEKKISAGALLVQADNALYHAKSNGSGWAFYEAGANHSGTGRKEGL